MHPVAVDESALVHAATSCRAIVRVGDSARDAEPAVLVIADQGTDAATLLRAGQVVRERV